MDFWNLLRVSTTFPSIRTVHISFYTAVNRSCQINSNYINYLYFTINFNTTKFNQRARYNSRSYYVGQQKI